MGAFSYELIRGLSRAHQINCCHLRAEVKALEVEVLQLHPQRAIAHTNAITTISATGGKRMHVHTVMMVI